MKESLSYQDGLNFHLQSEIEHRKTVFYFKPAVYCDVKGTSLYPKNLFKKWGEERIGIFLNFLRDRR